VQDYDPGDTYIFHFRLVEVTPRACPSGKNMTGSYTRDRKNSIIPVPGYHDIGRLRDSRVLQQRIYVEIVTAL
jgi:hypothetical protein